MQATPVDLQQAAALYASSGVAGCTNRQLPYLWTGQNQFWTGPGSVAVGEGASQPDGQQTSTGVPVGAPNAQLPAPALAAFHQQCVGTLQAALLSGALQQQQQQQQSAARDGLGPEKIEGNVGTPVQGVGVVGSMPGGGMGSNATSVPGAGLAQQPGISCLQIPGAVSGQLSNFQNPTSQVSPEYWQQAMALAAVQQAAAAGQMAGGLPLMGAPGSLGVLGTGPHAQATAPTVAGVAPVIADEKELKRQRRKLSNRESARRSRLRKQAELNDMIQDVQKFTVRNAHLKLEIQHLQECMNQLKEQNEALQVTVPKPPLDILTSCPGADDLDLGGHESDGGLLPGTENLSEAVQQFGVALDTPPQQSCAGAASGQMEANRPSDVKPPVA